MNTLVEIVRTDVFAFLENNNELLFNERDFQMHLTTWLRNSANHYDDVDVEYYVPCQELKNYVWKSELRLDIVVKKDGEYCPIELKYKTKKVERKISRFDELLDEKVIVMKNQGAQDLGMYGFWKDVKRLEMVKERFDSVKSGLSVFLTNDSYYKGQPGENSNNREYSMCGGLKSKSKRWLRETSITQSRPGFDLNKEYYIVWESVQFAGHFFSYCMIEI